MSDALKKNYDRAFYANQRAGSLESAKIVLDRLKPVLGEVRAALDVGCGAGGWLRSLGEAFPDAGLFGVDHPDVPAQQMFIDPANFSGRDLSEPFDLGRTFDIVLSLEVAEHVNPDRAEVFIDNLARHGDRIVFSAATPRQGGTGHVNEQWPSYWAEKFAARGYNRRDVIRPLIWDEDRVASWYKQNMMLYLRGDAATGDLSTFEDWGGRAVVHPGLWMRKTEPLARQIRRLIKGERPNHDWRGGA